MHEATDRIEEQAAKALCYALDVLPTAGTLYVIAEHFASAVRRSTAREPVAAERGGAVLLCRYIGPEPLDSASRYWAECDSADPRRSDYEYRWLHATPVAAEREAVAMVERVECVSWDKGYEKPAEPIWRIALDDYCADFETELAATNFADSVNRRLYAAPNPTGDYDYADLIERLETGVRTCGDITINGEEIYDIDDAETVMAEAATALSSMENRLAVFKMASDHNQQGWERAEARASADAENIIADLRKVLKLAREYIDQPAMIGVIDAALSGQDTPSEAQESK